MRDVFHEEIDAIGERLVAMAEQVGRAIADATAALLGPSDALAQAVISGDREIDELRWTVETRVIDLMARQQPVASDLRMLVSALRLASELERMGDLARHVADVALMRYPDPAVPEHVRETIAAMGTHAAAMAEEARRLLADRTLLATMDLDREDDAMDHLHRELFTRLLTREPVLPIETAIDVTLIGRYYERFADHAVTVSRQVHFVVTGVGHPPPPDRAAVIQDPLRG
jgi:phosphate transport system protein